MDSINLDMDQATILEQLASNYEQLPEQDIAVSLDNSTYAQYAMPTDRYRHGEVTLLI